MNALMAARRPRARRQSVCAVKSSDSGSTARRASSLMPRGLAGREQQAAEPARVVEAQAAPGVEHEVDVVVRERRRRRVEDAKAPRHAEMQDQRAGVGRRPAGTSRAGRRARMRAPASLAGSAARHAPAQAPLAHLAARRCAGRRARARCPGASFLPRAAPASHAGPASEPGPERGADDARLVVEARQVVEVDGALDVLFVGDVAAEQRDFPLAAVVRVADARAALEVARRSGTLPTRR